MRLVCTGRSWPMLNVRPGISPWTTSSGWRTRSALRSTNCSCRKSVERLVRPSGSGRPSLRAAGRPPSAAFRQAAAKRQYSFLPWVAKRYHPQTPSLEKCFVSERWVSAKCGFPQRPTRRESSPGNRPLGVCVEAQSTVTEFNRSSQLASQRRNMGHQSRVRVRAVGLMALASGPDTVWPLNAACAVSGKSHMPEACSEAGHATEF